MSLLPSKKGNGTERKAKPETDKAAAPSTPRSSNFELLRIIAMLAIVAFHMSVYSQIPDRGAFFAEQHSINASWIRYLNTFGFYGNFIFMLLSGYFLVDKRFKGFAIVKIILEMWFYSILIIYILIAAGAPAREAILDTDLLFPLYHGNNWYISNYLIVYCLSDLLNAAVKNTRRGLLFIILLFAMAVQFDFGFFFIHRMPVGKNIDTGRLTCFILLYMIGAFIKEYADDKKYCGKIYINIPLILYLLWRASKEIVFIDDIMFDVRVFLAALLTFMTFKKIDIGSSKVINLIGSTTLGIYLLHENPMTYELIWIYTLKVGDHAREKTFIPFSLLCAVGVFLVCMVLDLVRIRYFVGPLRKYALPRIKPVSDKAKARIKQVADKCVKRISRILDTVSERESARKNKEE